MKKCKNKKAFLGAILGSVAGAGLGIAGSALSANKQSRAQERIYKENLAATNRSNVLTSAYNLNSTYGDQEYVDDFTKKINIDGEYKMGGCKRKCKKRKKAENGGEWVDSSNKVIYGLQSLGTGAMQGNAALKNAKYNLPLNNVQAIKVGQPKEEAKAPSYANNLDYDRIQLYKCGGKRKRKK